MPLVKALIGTGFGFLMRPASEPPPPVQGRRGRGRRNIPRERAAERALLLFHDERKGKKGLTWPDAAGIGVKQVLLFPCSLCRQRGMGLQRISSFGGNLGQDAPSLLPTPVSCAVSRVKGQLSGRRACAVNLGGIAEGCRPFVPSKGMKRPALYLNRQRREAHV